MIPDNAFPQLFPLSWFIPVHITKSVCYSQNWDTEKGVVTTAQCNSKCSVYLPFVNCGHGRDL